MANTEQLKSSMGGMSERIKEDGAKLHQFLDDLVSHADANVRDLAVKAKEAASNVTTHFEAFAQTAMVAADSAPMRGAASAGSAPMRGAPRMQQPEPTRMSGVPATPPAGPSTTLGPAITHDDVGHIDPVTREAHAAPASVDEPSHKVGENGTEGSLVADETVK